jgi:hypothetical protein
MTDKRIALSILLLFSILVAIAVYPTIKWMLWEIPVTDLASAEKSLYVTVVSDKLRKRNYYDEKELVKGSICIVDFTDGKFVEASRKNGVTFIHYTNPVGKKIYDRSCDDNTFFALKTADVARLHAINNK